MTTPLSPEQRALELTDAFMSTEFNDEAEASARQPTSGLRPPLWLGLRLAPSPLARHIAQAIHDAIDAAEATANPLMQKWTPRNY
jgi:hypothetical protein